MAKYLVSGQPHTNSLKKNLEIYDFRLANPKAKLWEIGNAIPGYMKDQKIVHGQKPHETVDQRKNLAASVSRDLRVAKKYIANAGKGKFPNL